MQGDVYTGIYIERLQKKLRKTFFPVYILEIKTSFQYTGFS